MRASILPAKKKVMSPLWFSRSENYFTTVTVFYSLGTTNCKLKAKKSIKTINNTTIFAVCDFFTTKRETTF